jgi:Calcineurin-like phosphoesterase
MVSPERRSFSWLSLAPLWRSRNQIVGTLLGDPTNDERRRWMKKQRKAGKLQVDQVIQEHKDLEEFSFLVVGDTGEGDASQFAVVPPMLEAGKDTAFMVICSDVIYPSGDAEDYEEKFYRPYENYPGPIYALPGNHDWYDGLNGFIYHLCDAEVPTMQARSPEPVTSGTDSKRGLWKEPLRRRLWRKPSGIDPTVPTRKQVWRSAPGQRSSQRSPYFAIETGPLLIVGLDTGMGGGIDAEQGEWLRDISLKFDKPKVLITGKPIYVDGEYHPGVIECGGTVDDIVRDPAHRYVAAIGGDIHNYQRYRVTVRGHTRPIYYIVSGGGGAYMSATHQIRKVSLPGIDEEDRDEEGKSCFVCYPRRGDSLSFYSKLYDRKLAFGRGRLFIPPDEAAAIMAERLGIEPTRESAERVMVSERSRRAAAKVFPLPDRAQGALHLPFSEFFDWNEPPFFKSFLRLEAGPGELRIRCYGATGCAGQEQDPPVEDEVTIAL